MCVCVCVAALRNARQHPRCGCGCGMGRAPGRKTRAKSQGRGRGSTGGMRGEAKCGEASQGEPARQTETDRNDRQPTTDKRRQPDSQTARQPDRQTLSHADTQDSQDRQETFKRSRQRWGCDLGLVWVQCLFGYRCSPCSSCSSRISPRQLVWHAGA